MSETAPNRPVFPQQEPQDIQALVSSLTRSEAAAEKLLGYAELAEPGIAEAMRECVAEMRADLADWQLALALVVAESGGVVRVPAEAFAERPPWTLTTEHGLDGMVTIRARLAR